MLSFVCLHYEKRQWLKIESMKDAVDSRVWATFVEFDDTKNEEKFTFGQKWEKKSQRKAKNYSVCLWNLQKIGIRKRTKLVLLKINSR